ncbi:hypothetical protein [Actinoplanes sp. NPDC020271]|uniref:hypothetical protein n=1 Tax=Actinoplanes sp. NPDC020271 TaxID=3363896 RepID=UPI0037B04968
MNPQPDLHDQLSAIAEHGRRTLRPRPVDAIIARGGRRRRRARAAAGASALAVIAIAVTAVTPWSPRRPDPLSAPADAPAQAPASPAPAPDLTGRAPVTLQLAAGAGSTVVAGADDDDHVLADTGQTKQYRDEDETARSRWLLQPDGTTFTIALAKARPAGRVCMTGAADGSVRVRLCGAGRDQRFTLTPISNRQVYVLSLDGSPVRLSTNGQLTTRGTSSRVELLVAPAE